jgi:hypothetical protein
VLFAQIFRKAKSDDGTIMVDALVAVVVASLMIAVCLTSLNLSRRMSLAATDARQAQLTLRTLIETIPARPGHYSGNRDGMTYAAQVSKVMEHDVPLCSIDLALTKGKRSWRLKAMRWCLKDAVA